MGFPVETGKRANNYSSILPRRKWGPFLYRAVDEWAPLSPGKEDAANEEE
jgi:hypothetical protein